MFAPQAQGIDPVNIQYQPIHPQQAPAYQIAGASPRVQSVIPQISARLVELIQESLNNPPRVFFYNQIAANGYQNNMFVQLLSKSCELADMVAVVNRGDLGALDGILISYVQYKIAEQLFNNPQLAQLVDRNALHAAQTVMNAFLNTASQLEQAAGQISGRGFQQQVRSPAASVFSNNLGSPVSATSQVFSNAHVTPAAPGTQTASNRWGTPNAPQVPVATQQAQAAQQEQPKPASTEINLNPNLYFEKSTPVVNIQTEPLDQAATASATPEAFTRSDEYPYNFVYDPNQFEYRIETVRGKTRVFFSKLIPMDRNAHLGRTNVMPKSIQPVTRDEFLKRVDSAKAVAAEQGKEGLRAEITLNPLFSYKDSLNAALTVAQTHEYNQRSPGDRIRGYSFHAGIYQAINAGYDVRPFVNDLLTSSTVEATVARIHREIDNAGTDYAKLTAIRQINQRITRYVNRYIKLQACLEYGDIEDYADDILTSLEQVLGQHYGQTVRDNFVANHHRILVDALSYETNPECLANLQAECQLAASDEDELEENPNLIYFVEFTGVTSLNISSAELSFQIPDLSLAALVRESEAPLLHGVLTTIVEAFKSDESFCSRHVIRLADGVVLELTRGAFVEDALLVSVVK